MRPVPCNCWNSLTQKLPFWCFPDYTQYLINCDFIERIFSLYIEMEILATLVQGGCRIFLMDSQQFDFLLWHHESFILNITICIHHYPHNDISLIISNHWTSNDWTLDKYPQNYPINHWTINLWYFPNIISIINSMITLIISRWFGETYHI